MARIKYVAAKHCRRFGIVDLAFTEKKQNDYTVIMACAVTPNAELLILDVHRERMEGPKILPAVEAMIKRWDLAYVGVESVQSQLVVVQLLRQRGWTIRELRAESDKISRAIPATVRFEAGQVFLREGAPWLDDYVDELLAFSKGAHDDQVDATAYAAIEVQRFGAAAEPAAYGDARDYVEKELAAEFFNRAANPMFWSGDDDE